MDRRHFSFALAATAAAIQSFSFGRPVAAATGVKPDEFFIAAKDAKTTPMAEWEVDQQGRGEQMGARVLIAEGPEVDKAPANASRYEAKTYKFPTGVVRVLTWKKGSGPVVHQVTFETQIYVLQGSVEVGVQGVPTKVGTGDAVFLPSGLMRNTNPTEDTVVVQFFVSNTAKDPKSVVVRGKDQKARLLVQWEQDGKDMSASTDDEVKKAPASAARFDVILHAFDGNSIRLANLKKGGKTSHVKNGIDTLIYITKGRMRRTEAEHVFEVAAGDVLLEAAGKTGFWELLEDSAFLATNAPLNPNAVWVNPS